MSELTSAYPSVRTEAVRWIRYVMEGIVLLMVALSPWFYGAVDPIFQYGLFAGISLICLLWGICSVLQNHFLWFSCPVPLAMMGIFIVGAVQLAPLPSWMLKIVSPATASIERDLLPEETESLTKGELSVPHSGWHTISAYPTATRQLLMPILALTALFAAVRTNIASTNSLKRLAWVAVANGVLLSLYGIGQFVHDRSLPAGATRAVYGLEVRSEVFGPFINRNHFAYYANICIGLTVGLLLIGSRSEGDKRARRTYKAQALEEQTADEAPTLSILGILHSPLQLWLSVAMAVTIGGLICCMSRGGVFAIAAGATIAFALRGFGGRRVRQLELAVIPALLAVGFVTWLSVKPLESRLNPFAVSAATDGRLQIWRNLLPLTWRYPILGTGYGTLQYVEPPFRERDYEGYNADVFIDHAHNDYLEAFVEGGILRFALTGALVYFLLRFGRQAMKRHEVRTPGRLAFGALIGIAAVAVHSFVDFGLFTPAVAILATVTAAQLCAMARTNPSEAPDERAKHSLVIEMGGWGGIAALGVFVVLAVLMTGFASRQARVYSLRIQAYQSLNKLHNPQLAATRLRSAVELAPDDAELRSELGQIYLDAWQGRQKQQVEDAGITSVGQAGIEEMIKARDLCPLLARPHARLAAWAKDTSSDHPRMATSDPAQLYWNRALRLTPYDANLLYFAGLFQLQRGNDDDAWRLWRQSLQNHPTHLAAIVANAVRSHHADNLLASILPDDPAIFVTAAKHLSELGGEEPVRKKILSKAKSLLGQPNDGESSLRLAQCCALLQDVDSARTYFMLALDFAPDRSDWRLEYARFLYSLQTDTSRREALKELGKALEGNPRLAGAAEFEQIILNEISQPTPTPSTLPKSRPADKNAPKE